MKEYEKKVKDLVRPEYSLANLIRVITVLDACQYCGIHKSAKQHRSMFFGKHLFYD